MACSRLPSPHSAGLRMGSACLLQVRRGTGFFWGDVQGRESGREGNVRPYVTAAALARGDGIPFPSRASEPPGTRSHTRDAQHKDIEPGGAHSGSMRCGPRVHRRQRVSLGCCRFCPGNSGVVEGPGEETAATAYPSRGAGSPSSWGEAGRGQIRRAWALPPFALLWLGLSEG
jgi:hypothetical protein